MTAVLTGLVQTPDASTVSDTFSVSRTFTAGQRIQVCVAHKTTGLTVTSCQFNGVDDFSVVDPHDQGTNIVHQTVLEGVISSSATANLVVTLSASLAGAGIIISTVAVGGAESGAGYRDAPNASTGASSGPTTATDTVAGDDDDLAIMWTTQRGTSSATTPDGNTLEVGQEETGVGAGHIRTALWYRVNASPSVDLGGTWSSGNGHARVSMNINSAEVSPLPQEEIDDALNGGLL